MRVAEAGKCCSAIVGRLNGWRGVLQEDASTTVYLAMGDCMKPLQGREPVPAGFSCDFLLGRAPNWFKPRV